MKSPATFGSLRKNYFFSAFAALIGVAYPVLATAYAARVLGPESLGKYYFAASLATYFLVVASLGIPVYGTRELGRARETPEGLRKVFSELFAITLASNLVAALVYLGVVAALPELRAEARLFGVMTLLFVGGAFNFDFFYAARERQDLMALRSLASKAVSIVLILLLVHAPDDYVIFAAIIGLGVVANAAFGLGSLRYWSGWKSLSWGTLSRHFRPLLHFVSATLFINIYATLDSVILGMLSNAHQVGLYGSVMRPVRLYGVMLSSLITVAMPRLSYYLREGGEGAEGREIHRKTLHLTLLICVPVMVLMMAIPEALIRAAYGAEFLEAAPALRLAGPMALMTGLSSFCVYQVLLPLGKERLLLPLAIVTAATSACLNFLLIPTLGHLGAVCAAMVADGLSTTLLIVIALRLGRGHGEGFIEAWKYVVAGCALGACLRLVPAGGFFGPIGAGGLLAFGAYGAVLWVVRERFARQAARAARARLSGG